MAYNQQTTTWITTTDYQLLEPIPSTVPHTTSDSSIQPYHTLLPSVVLCTT